MWIIVVDTLLGASLFEHVLEDSCEAHGLDDFRILEFFSFLHMLYSFLAVIAHESS